MAKHLREIFPEGKIIGFRHNNLWIGDPDQAKKIEAPKAAVLKAADLLTVRAEGEEEYDINLYLMQINRDDTTPTPGPLQPPPPDLPYNPDYFTTPLFMKIKMFVPDYEPGIECISTNTHQATLMDVIKYAVDPTPAQATPPNPAWTDPTFTHISALRVTSDSQPQINTIPDWLDGFSFFNSAIEDPTKFYSDSTYGPIYQKPDGHYYIDYTGSDWLYFIGTPQSQPFYYSGTHGSPYPKLRLDEFPVGAVPCVEGDEDVYDVRNFTLSYETQSFTFRVDSATVDGETVHTLIKPDKFK
jgi:hypothetical protein